VWGELTRTLKRISSMGGEDMRKVRTVNNAGLRPWLSDHPNLGQGKARTGVELTAVS